MVMPIEALDRPQQAARIHQGLTGRLFINSLFLPFRTGIESVHIKQHIGYDCHTLRKDETGFHQTVRQPASG